MIRRGTAFACAILLILVALALAAPDPSWLKPGDRLDDAAFWRLFTEFSEPGGSFRSDNLVSNERTFPSILPELALHRSGTSAYIGVGPEQNFSYLAAIRPRIAFIFAEVFDRRCRRQRANKRRAARPKSQHAAFLFARGGLLCHVATQNS